MNFEQICSNFDLEPGLGFLGHLLQDEKLPECFSEIQKIAEDLVALVPTGKIRQMIEESSRRITMHDIYLLDKRQREVAFAQYTFLLHAYVRGRWREEQPVDILHVDFSMQLTLLAELLGCKPIGTFASTVTFNWRLLFREDNKQSGDTQSVQLDELGMKYLITGSVDEAWFYLVSASVDALSPKILRLACSACTDPENFDWKPIVGIVGEATKLLKKMYDENMQEYFYGKVRKYMSGWKNDAHLPKGVLYTFPDGRKEWLMLSGASAAQSATIQLLDIMLGIKHEGHQAAQNGVSTTGVGDAGAFLREMREYMPSNHRQCLLFFEKELEAVQPILQRKPEYFKAKTAMQTFRRTHLSLVQDYIIKFGKDSKGTGGSNPTILLNQLLDDTKN